MPLHNLEFVEKPFNQSTYTFFSADDRMSEFARRYHWQDSPLGVPDRWPQSLRTLVQMILNSPLPMAVLWGTELITLYNDTFHELFGARRPHAFGQPAAMLAEGIWPEVVPPARTVAADGRAVTLRNQPLDFYKIDHTSSSFWDYSLSPLTSDGGNIDGVLLTCSEKTSEIENARQLILSQQRFQNLVRDASMGIILLEGPEMRVEIVNQAYAQLINRKPEELQGRRLFDVIPEARDPFHGIIEEVRSTGNPLYLFHQPYSVVSEDGPKEGYLDLVYQPYKEADGYISGVIILCQDMTQQVLSRQKLEISEARLRSVVESAPFPIGVYVGREMLIQLVNQSIIDVWGKGTDIVGKRYAEVLPELADKGIYEQLDQVYMTGKPYYAHNQRVDLMIEGQLKSFYFKYNFTPLFDAEGNVYGVMNTAADVTDLVVAQQQLVEAEASLRDAIALARLGSWELNLATGQVSYSDTIREWFGFSAGQIELPEVYNPIHPEDRMDVESAIRHALEPGSTGTYDAEYRLNPFSGSPERIIHARGKVLYDIEGQAYKLVGTAQDVTDERRRQQELEQVVEIRTEELAALNEELAAQNEEYMAINEELEEANQQLLRSNENLQQFAYVASHDLQEPLRKIQQFSDILKTRYQSQTGEAAIYLERVQSAASRMSILIRDLLDFSSISTRRGIHQPVALNKVIDNVLNVLELAITDSAAEIRVDNLPTISGEAMQLGQLFQNLLSNALKFRRPGQAPSIHVKASKVTLAELPRTAAPARSASTYHLIEVIDNGIGFDEQYLDRIFQVFQRLHGKSEFGGTGIGLAICERVVTNHGGAITAMSQVGQGATFRIYFPV
ncbi:PAS domain-containing protein [Dyadobacter sandarakinus]|uniref:histidine kinase n=1 Tax=Dyadobacter sandarakinus TaxID=2747268 RepID=A0ABX7I8M2_9BACT|nr:PAS domain-containing protein [Dyadobacter sandarakinus]QRR02449.1 PAS domain-containing protein [Dyadobacter sandarakinus]